MRAAKQIVEINFGEGRHRQTRGTDRGGASTAGSRTLGFRCVEGLYFRVAGRKTCLYAALSFSVRGRSVAGVRVLVLVVGREEVHWVRGPFFHLTPLKNSKGGSFEPMPLILGQVAAFRKSTMFDS